MCGDSKPWELPTLIQVGMEAGAACDASRDPAVTVGTETDAGAEPPTTEAPITSTSKPDLVGSGVDATPVLAAGSVDVKAHGHETAIVSERSSSRFVHRRGCVVTATSASANSSEGAESSAAAHSSAGRGQSAEAMPELTAAELKAEFEERSALMFVVGSAAAVASGRRAVLPHATNEAVQIGWEVIKARCKADGKALSRSFGNFDQRVGLGWLFGDMVCGFFIPFADALAVGAKAVKAGPDLKAEFGAPSRRAGKARYATAEDRERSFAAAAIEEANLRRADAELPLPAPLPPEPPANAKRQRVSAPMPPPPARAKPVRDQEMLRRAELQIAAANADKALIVTEGALAGAKRAHARAVEAYERALRCVRKAAEAGIRVDVYQIDEERWDAMQADQTRTAEAKRKSLHELCDAEMLCFDARLAAEHAHDNVRNEERMCELRAEVAREDAEAAARKLEMVERTSWMTWPLTCSHGSVSTYASIDR